jgi:hypothetical protein
MGKIQSRQPSTEGWANVCIVDKPFQPRRSKPRHAGNRLTAAGLIGSTPWLLSAWSLDWTRAVNRSVMPVDRTRVRSRRARCTFSVRTSMTLQLSRCGSTAPGALACGEAHGLIPTERFPEGGYEPFSMVCRAGRPIHSTPTLGHLVVEGLNRLKPEILAELGNRTRTRVGTYLQLPLIRDWTTTAINSLAYGRGMLIGRLVATTFQSNGLLVK